MVFSIRKVGYYGEEVNFGGILFSKSFLLQP